VNEVARVAARFGAELILRMGDGELRRAVARRNLAKDQPPHLRAAVCGDFVNFEDHSQEKRVVVGLRPRKNILLRPNHRGRPLATAANIDQVLIVIAPCPAPDLRMIDRYLAAIAAMPSEAVIVINKVDLLETARDELMESTAALYTGLGFPVIHVSAATGEGIDEIEKHLQGKTTLLAGQSGVGKSSLARALIPDIDIRIGQLSAVHGEGCHATSLARLYGLDSSGELIDSPGVRGFSPYQAKANALAVAFPEITGEALHCRFHDCQHTAEPGCAIKFAVNEGRITSTRLRHYLEIYAETKRS